MTDDAPRSLCGTDAESVFGTRDIYFMIDVREAYVMFVSEYCPAWRTSGDSSRRTWERRIRRKKLVTDVNESESGGRDVL